MEAVLSVEKVKVLATKQRVDGFFHRIFINLIVMVSPTSSVRERHHSTSGTPDTTSRQPASWKNHAMDPRNQNLEAE
jgi:hypothetical protein